MDLAGPLTYIVIDPKGRSHQIVGRAARVLARLHPLLLHDINELDTGRVELSWGSRDERVAWKDKEIGRAS